MELSAQERGFLLKGVIIDSTSNKPIPDISIISKENHTIGTLSAPDGSFTLELPKAQNTIVLYHLNYKQKEIKVDLEKEQDYVWVMSLSNIVIDELVISSNKPSQRLESVQIGVERIEVESLLKTPTFMGQRDIIRSLTLLPGIKQESDASSGFQVRGGSASQNLVLLDDMPVYNAGHLMGMFSIFNDDIVSSASLYKGLMGAEFSGGSSSVLDISSKGGIADKFALSADIGILSSSLYIKTPIIEDKLSFQIAGRRSYYDLFLAFSDEYKDNISYFYDLNAKLDARLSENDRLSISFFTGKDLLGLDEVMEMGWKNNGSSLQWYHRYNDRFTSRTSLIMSRYSSDASTEAFSTEFGMEGGINNYGIKHNFNLELERHILNFGIHASYVSLLTAEWKFRGITQREESSGFDCALYISDSWKISPQLEVKSGLRLSVFAPNTYKLINNTNENLLKRGIQDAYFILEPRLTLNYLLTENQSLKGGYSRLSQNIHALRGLSMSLPFDRSILTGGLVRPQVSDQVSIGYSILMPNQVWEFSLETYYKQITGVYDYKDGKDFTSDIILESIILGGEGRSYGFEALIRKNLGDFTCWLGYTLSWSENKIKGINNGDWYTAGNDRRHDISIVGMYDLGKGWSASCSWVYNTGQALTAPSAKYQIGDTFYYYYSERNGYRAPEYHRLDVSVSHKKSNRKYERELTLGIYNLYNRYNPFMITFENYPSSPTGTKAIQTSLFGIIPSVSYSITF